MAIIVIGGHSRNVGKTSVVAGLIAALSSHNWTAFKVTQFGHGRCSLNGKPCHCATSDHTWAISEEKDRSGKSDSSRFLVAGAKRSFWVRTEQGRLAEAVPTIARRLAESENAILESNSILKFIQPDLYISVLDPAVEDFKASALAGLGRADALIVNADHSGDPQWKEITLNTTGSRPLFRIQPPPYVTAELVEFVQTKLSLLSSSSRLS
jgi:molybdopterin-guanine dinucleotide biosynthesis protein